MFQIASQVVWAAFVGLVPRHEADFLWERHVGHLLLQQTEGWSDLQGLFPSHPQTRCDALKQTRNCVMVTNLVSFERLAH